MSSSRKRTILWAGTSLGVALFLAMLYRYDPATVLAPLLDSEPTLLITTVAILIMIQQLNALGLTILLGEPDRGEIPFWSRARLFFALQPLTLFAPGRLSDLAAAPLLREHYRSGSLASTIVLDRLVTVFSLLVLAPVAFRGAWSPKHSSIIDASLVLGLMVVASVPFLLSNHRFRELVNRWLLRYWPSLLRGFGAHMETVLHLSPVRLIGNFAVTIVKMMLSALVLFLMAKNVGVSLGVLATFWMSIVVQLITAIPISIQGIGVAEGTLVALFSANDLPAAMALSLQIVSRFLLLIVTFAIYLFVTVPLIRERLAKS